MIDGRMVPLNSEPRRPSVPHMKSSVHPHSRADLVQRKRVSIAQNQALAAGVPRTPEEDLKYRGGKTVRDLAYVNIFVGGKELWNPSDRENIDWAMEAALQDPNLNHVMMQYFDDQPISAEALGSFYLSGYKPKVVLQSNIRDVVTSLYKSGAFKGLPLTRTCINFLLPQGATLEDPNTARAEAIHKANPAIPFEDEATSREGLGGYHGSVHLGAETVYYAVCVYSERRADGFTNGIPAFPEPWKSTAATFYHELQEFRTDADVDDAMEGRANALGWTSDTGLECGDFPLSEAPTLQSMFQDVPLSDGRGVVPVQFQYSNAVHGPEGPIDAPHRGKPLPLPAKRLPPPGTSPSPPPVKPTPPVTADEGLETLVKNWKRLPQQTRDQILRLLQNGGQ